MVANTGGSILSFDWLPLPPSQEDPTHFLAVSTNCLLKVEHPHILEEQFACEGVIQLWAFVGSKQVTGEGVADGDLRAQLLLCVAHEYGYIRRLKWCPSNTFVALGDGDKVCVRARVCACVVCVFCVVCGVRACGVVCFVCGVWYV